MDNLVVFPEPVNQIAKYMIGMNQILIIIIISLLDQHMYSTMFQNTQIQLVRQKIYTEQ